MSDYTPEQIAEALAHGRDIEHDYRRVMGKPTSNRSHLIAIIEQQRERITALKAKADLACAALVGAGKEIVSLKQCHHCKHGDHRHAADTKRCINTIERRCQCEENPA